MNNIDDNVKIERFKLNGRQTQKKCHSLELEEQFFNLFLKGDSKCLEFVHAFENFNQSDLGCGEVIRSSKNKLIVTCAILTHRMVNLGIDHQRMYLESDSWINLIEEKESKEQLKHLEHELLNYFLSIVQDHLNAHYSDIIRRTIFYVQRNFKESLCLNSIAKAVHVHPNYLSYLFKKETKMGLSEYVSKVRIDEAKVRLRYSSQSIRSIANDVGFSQPSYFTQQFRKIVGVTPTKFRQSNLL